MNVLFYYIYNLDDFIIHFENMELVKSSELKCRGYKSICVGGGAQNNVVPPPLAILCQTHLKTPFLKTYVNYSILHSNFLKGGGHNVAKGGGQKIRQSLLILWCKLQGMKNIDGNVSKKYLYFHRIDTYCIINYDIKYIFTLKAVLIKAFLNETFS